MALGDAPRMTTLHVVSEGNPGMTTLVPWHAATYDRTMLCQVETGLRLVKMGYVPVPTAVKVDVEGSEPSVLRGMSDLLNRPQTSRVVVEGGPEIAELLEHYGFHVRELERAESTDHALRNYLGTKP